MQEVSFGSWLRQRRTELGIAREKLAERVGFSLDLLKKLESGERRPSGQIAQLLAEYFRIPNDELEAFVIFARSGQAASGEASAVAPWRTLRPRHTNLPSVLTLLIGREEHEKAARDILLNPRVRLLTLTGPPGIGKTRLGLRVASDLVEHFEDGVFFVDLSPVVSPELVLPAVARVLRLKETAGPSIEEVLFEHVHKRRMLLLLDNFEQVLDAGPEVVRLMEVSPWLKVLVTSREALHVRGERRYLVPPLGLPDPGKLSSAKVEVIAAPSVELFVERARAVAADFALVEANTEKVAAICLKLEGLPLAIELAAARARHLSLQNIDAALDNRLKLLTGGARDLPARHRTLHAAIEWSYNLLDEAEQRLFRQLGLFVGGFTVDAAQAVSGDQITNLNMLLSLVDKNLVKQEKLGSEAGEGQAEEARFGILEAIRELALEKLEANGEAREVSERHAKYCLSVAEEAGQRLGGSDQKATVERLEREHANIRAALRFLLDEGEYDEQALELAMRLGGALSMFWYMRGYTSEGRRWLEAMIEAQDSWLARRGPSTHEPGEAKGDWILPRAVAMSALGLMAYMQADLRMARYYYGESLSLSKQAGDRLLTARALNNLGMTATQQLDLGMARDYYEEALQLAQELGQSAGITRILNNLGVIAHKQGDYDGARRYYEESLKIRRALEDKQGEAVILSNVAGIAVLSGDLAAAQALYSEALEIGQELGDKFAVARALVGLGDVALGRRDYGPSRSYYYQGLRIAWEIDTKQVIYEAIEGLVQVAAFATPPDPARAAKLLGGADAVREAANAPRYAEEQRQIEDARADSQGLLEDAAWQAAWVEGHAMTIDEAIDYALSVAEQ
jgi:predicted ATPase/transcriptional regulator with XRE-family HTH domain/Tfp pilus assembly protein PilF